LPTEEGALLITLMPLATESTADGYLTRIERWVETLRGDSLAAGLPSDWTFYDFGK